MNMFIIPISVMFSLVQVLALIALVRVLGPSEYAEYSLSFSVAVFISALSSEWIRLIVARYSGSRARRLRGALIKTSLVWVYMIAAGVAIASVVVQFSLLALNRGGVDCTAITVGMLACSSIVGDCGSTFVRFNLNARKYLEYVVLRVSLSSLLLILSAWWFKTAVSSAAFFSLGVIGVALYFTARYWLPESGRVNHRRLFGVAAQGWAMAASAITSNGSLAFARLAIQRSVEPAVAGSIFLAIDLIGRGVTVLGSALNTWSAKLLYEASHKRGGVVASNVTERTSALFAAAWGTLGVGGAAASLLIPLVVGGFGAYGSAKIIVVVNVLAILMLTARVFSVDVLLNAHGKYNIVTIASGVAISATVLATISDRTAGFALPLGVICSFAVVAVAGRGVPPVRRALIDTLYLAALGAGLSGVVGYVTVPVRVAVVIESAILALLCCAWSLFQFRRWNRSG